MEHHPSQMKSLLLSLAVAVALGVSVTAAGAKPPRQTVTTIRIGEFSSQVAPNHASVRAHIAMQKTRPPQAHIETQLVEAPPLRAPQPPPVPTLASDSPLLQNPHPLGPGTLWYQGLPGQQCIYVADSSALCFAVVQPNGHSLDPVAVAAEVARTMDLSLPPIEASPSANRGGLTGDRSWFWLTAAPSRSEQTVSLGAETVTITVDPSATEWGFGDGGGQAGGPGVAYQPGPTPAAAITHVYETRCLPGDQGRNPNVLPNCEGDGYHVLARVNWTISFTATGPVAASGGLPTRTTESELVYPVSEARAFLVGGSP
jgi:hypothetical protein